MVTHDEEMNYILGVKLGILHVVGKAGSVRRVATEERRLDMHFCRLHRGNIY